MKISFFTNVLLILSVAILSGCATTLHQAATDNDIVEVRSLLAQGRDANEINNQFGITPLMIAAEMNHVEVCRLLISKGAKVNQGSTGGLTALMSASSRGQIETCKLLITEGANVNQLTQSGDTALMYASQSGHVEVCKLLISKGAKVNQSDNNGYTALARASLYGRIETCKLLILKGANVNEKGIKGETPLMLATVSPKIVKLLLANGANVNQRDDEGDTALIIAARAGRQDSIKILLEHGANPSLANKAGMSAQNYHDARVTKEEAAERHRAQQQAQQREESGSFLRGMATLATGIAVGDSTRNLSSDQQTRMMRSSMEAVNSGDASGFTDTSRQVRGEQAQAHQERMREIEAKKERERLASSQSDTPKRTKTQSPSTANSISPSGLPPSSGGSNYGCLMVRDGNNASCTTIRGKTFTTDNCGTNGKGLFAGSPELCGTGPSYYACFGVPKPVKTCPTASYCEFPDKGQRDYMYPIAIKIDTRNYGSIKEACERYGGSWHQ